jgi:hypothetical protein
MMPEFKAPQPIKPTPNKSVFIAGSIEMGKAVDWQKAASANLVSLGYTVYNPRRDDWDSSWSQDLADARFVEQVQWELQALEEADRILLYFAPETKSPISLLELGLYAYSGKLTVVCPEGFWRKGNVDLVCMRYRVPQYKTIADALETF